MGLSWRPPRLSAQELAHLRSVVVDGPKRPKHRAAGTLSPLRALCGSEEGSLIHRHFLCSEVPDGESYKMLGPFNLAAQSGTSWQHESFTSHVLLPALKGPPPHWTGDRSLCTGVVRRWIGKTQACAWQVEVW